MDLSIVIPAYEEREKIGRDILAASEFLRSYRLTGEVIVVDDASRDGTAEEVRRASAGAGVSVKAVCYERHRGKGYAVRRGMSETSGTYVMFADSGCCVPYSNALVGLEMLQRGECDIAHGSRKLAESNIRVAQRRYRRFCSRVFRSVVRWSLGLGREITDSQCGFKIYRGQVGRQLYERCVTDGFMFDVEVILRAQRQGYRIKEFPIVWSCDLDSRLSVSRSLWTMSAELMRIRRVVSSELD